ncbi:MAG: FHA domain-containing protein [Faecousia sp.]
MDTRYDGVLQVSIEKAEFDEEIFAALNENWPQALLPFSCFGENGSIVCMYSLTHRTPILKETSSYTLAQYAALLQKAISPLLRYDQLLIRPEMLVTEPKYIYLNLQNGEIRWLYLPVKTCNAAKKAMEQLEAQTVSNRGATAYAEDGTINAASKYVPTMQETVFASRQVYATAGAARQFERSETNQTVLDVASQTLQRHGGEQEEHTAPADAEAVQFCSQTEQETIQEQGPRRADSLFAGHQRQKDVEATNDIRHGRRNKTSKCAYLHLTGDPQLPKLIPVTMEMGRAFSIGRFDLSIGSSQSDFEFAKNTVAVSRHHAKIWYDENGYWMEDMMSTAGTYVDGNRLREGAAVRLTDGCRVSFGTGGADYIWEEGI